MMEFDRRGLVRMIAIGLGLTTVCAWVAAAGVTTSVWPFTSSTVMRALGAVGASASLAQTVPFLGMLARRHNPAIEGNNSFVTIRAVSGKSRVIEWTDIERVELRRNAVDLRLRSGGRVRAYGQVIAARHKKAMAEVAEFFAKRVAH